MRARLAAAWLLLALAAPARGEEFSDWFEPFRGAETYLVEDSSWLARDPAQAAEAPPVLRVRHLLLRMKTENAQAAWWERRNVLLIELPGGSRYAAEIAMKLSREGHVVEPVPWMRIAGPTGSVETWSLRGDGEPDVIAGPPGPSDPPCAGDRILVRGGGRSLSYHFESSATVRALLAEIRDATFAAAEREELWSLRRLPVESPRPPVPSDTPNLDDFLSARLAWGLLFLDRKKDPAEPRLVLSADPAPAGDLASWRSLTYIPQAMRMDLPVPGLGE